MSIEDLQEELTLTRRQLRDAMKLLESAECGVVGSQAQMWEQKLQELEEAKNRLLREKARTAALEIQMRREGWTEEDLNEVEPKIEQ
jgi:hypothetical protein